MSYRIRTKYDGFGVYAIVNIEKMKCYIGSSRNVFKRAKNHKSCLKHQKHHIKELQEDYNNHCELDFIVLIKSNHKNDRILLLQEYTAMFSVLKEGFDLYNTVGIRGNDKNEIIDCLARDISNRYSCLYCNNLNYELRNKYPNLTGYKISHSILENKRRQQEKNNSSND